MSQLYALNVHSTRRGPRRAGLEQSRHGVTQQADGDELDGTECGLQNYASLAAKNTIGGVKHP